MTQCKIQQITSLVGFGGKGIKKGLIYEGEAYNYDFGVLMAATLGLEFEKANGVVLDIFEQDE